MAKFNEPAFSASMEGSLNRHIHRMEHSDTAEERLAARVAVAVLSSLSLAIEAAYSGPPIVEKKRKGRPPKRFDDTRKRLLRLLNTSFRRNNHPIELDTNLDPWYSEATGLKRAIKGEFGVAIPVHTIRLCVNVDILSSIINNYLEAKANGV